MTQQLNTDIAARRPLFARLGARAIPALMALMTFAAVLGNADAAQAKQCVWNKGWFVLGVHWYDRDDMFVVTLPNGQRDLRVRAGARPMKIDNFPAAQGRCFTHPRRERAVAVLRVWGGEFFTDFMKGFLTPLIAGGAVAATIKGCAATAGAGCPAVVAGTGAALGHALSVIPKRSEVFGVVIPRTDRWTDVWGTAFGPRANINVGGRF